MVKTADVHSQCAGKETFDTPRAAAKAKQSLAKRQNAAPRHGLEPYRCTYCHRWHLGRAVRQSNKQLKLDHARLVKRGSVRFNPAHSGK